MWWESKSWNRRSDVCYCRQSERYGIQGSDPSAALSCISSADSSSRDRRTGGGGSETEVTWEDQQNINKFGRLNNRFHDSEDEIKLAKEMNESLEDAGNELILAVADEEVIRYQIGQVFVHLSSDEVEKIIEKMKEETSKNMEKLEEEKESVVAQMTELKKILYGKVQRVD